MKNTILFLIINWHVMMPANLYMHKPVDTGDRGHWPNNSQRMYVKVLLALLYNYFLILLSDGELFFSSGTSYCRIWNLVRV